MCGEDCQSCGCSSLIHVTGSVMMSRSILLHHLTCPGESSLLMLTLKSEFPTALLSSLARPRWCPSCQLSPVHSAHCCVRLSQLLRLLRAENTLSSPCYSINNNLWICQSNLAHKTVISNTSVKMTSILLLSTSRSPTPASQLTEEAQSLQWIVWSHLHVQRVPDKMTT